MIYQVMLSENQSVLIENVNHVSTDEETVRFCGKGGSLVAAFKMYNIVGFFRMDVPTELGIAEPPEPEYKWDFDKLEEIKERQFKEAEERKQQEREWKEKRKAEAMETARKRINKEANRAARILKEYIYVHGEIMEECTEVATEAMERQTFAKGDDIHVYERKILKQLLKENMDKCIGVNK